MSDTLRILHRITETQSGEIFACVRRSATPADAADAVVAAKSMVLSRRAVARTHKGRRQLPDSPHQERRVADLLATYGGHENL
ncbi:unnamed protein product, partial [Globisporangium polare]